MSPLPARISSAAPAGRAPVRAGVAALALLVVALAVGRVATRAAPPLWLDEMMQVETAAQPTWAGWWRWIPRDKPPLEYLVLRLWGMEGRDVAGWRLPATLAGVATALLLAAGVAGTARRRTATPPAAPASASAAGPASTPLGLAAAALLLAHPIHWHVGQQLVPYASGTLWLALGAGAVWRALAAAEGRTGVGPAPGAGWVLAALPCLLAAYLSAYTFLFPVAALLAATGAIAWRRRAGSRWLGVGVVAGAVFGAAVAAGMARMGDLLAAGPTYPFPRGGELLREAGDGLLGIKAAAGAGAPAAGVLAAARLALELLLLAAGTLVAARRRSSADLLALAWCWGGAALLLAAFAHQDHWLDVRYFVPFAVPMALLQAEGLAAAWRAAARGAAAARGRAVGVLLPIVAALAVATLGAGRAAEVGAQRAAMVDYHAIALAARELPPGSALLADSDQTAWAHEFERRRRVAGAPPALWLDAADATLAARLADHERLYLLPVTLAPAGENPWIERIRAGGRLPLTPEEVMALRP